MHPSLMPHQIDTVEYGIKNPYCILALQMGLGKSICALEIFARLKKERGLTIVCPSYLISNWEKEIEKFYPGKYKVLSIRSGAEATLEVKDDVNIVIVSYDLGMKAEKSVFSKWCHTLILDEANYLKEMNTKRSQFYHRCIFEYALSRVYLLTGTPIKNRVSEFYSLMAICNYNPRLNNTSKFLDEFKDMPAFADKFSFRQEYNIQTNYGTKLISKWTGLRNVEELKTHLSGIYIRFRSEDVLTLPDVIYKEIQIFKKQDKELMEAFDKLDIGSSVLPEAKKNAAVFSVPYTIDYVKKELLESDEPVVIYTDHVQSCEELARAFNVKGIHGAIPVEERFRIASEFQSGKTKVLVATIKSFSTGIDLTVSRNLVFNDIPWVPGDLEQAIYRIVRISQKRGCMIHKLFTSPQSKKIHDVILGKMNVIEKVV